MPPIVPSPNHQATVCHHHHQQLTKELSQRLATAGAPIDGRGGVIITQRPSIACLPSQPLEPHWDPIIISKPSLPPSSSPPPAHREISKHGPGAWGPLLGDGFHPQGAPSYQPTCLTYNSSHPLPRVWSVAIIYPNVCHKTSESSCSCSIYGIGQRRLLLPVFDHHSSAMIQIHWTAWVIVWSNMDILLAPSRALYVIMRQ